MCMASGVAFGDRVTGGTNNWLVVEILVLM